MEEKALKDEELSKVTGGGSGTVPEGGITFNSYESPDECHYYSADKKFADVVYVFKQFGSLYFRTEKFTVNKDGTWSSYDADFNNNPVTESFKVKFLYELNVQP